MKRIGSLAWILVVCVVGVIAGRAVAQPSGGLRVAKLPIRTDGPKSLDPVKGSTVYDNQACSSIYDTLLQYKYLKRPLELEPCLAAEMPVITDGPNGTQVWHFKLKQGVRFHDDACFPNGIGREMTVDDIFYSWKRLADPKYEYENWWLVEDTIVGFDAYKAAQKQAVDDKKPFDYAAPVEGLRKIGPYEFEVILTKPVTRFRWVLAMFQLSVVPREGVEMHRDRFAVHPIGTGPFMVKEGDWKPADKLIYTRNPKYRDEFYPAECMPEDKEAGLDAPAGKKIPFLDRIEIPFFVQDQPMWLEFTKGQIGYTQVPSEYFEQAFVKRTRKLRSKFQQMGIRGHAEPLLDFIFRGFNMEDPVVGGYTPDKIALRQALCLAVDLQEFNEKFYNGINTEYDGPIPPGLDAYPPGGETPVNYRGPDIDLAKELLAKAGYPGGKGLPPLNYYVAQGGNEAEQTQMLTRQFERIGVKLNPRLVDFSELIELINNKKAQFFGFAWGTDYPDAENNLALFYSRNKSPGSNHYNYERKEYDEMYEQIRVMQPSPERTKIMEKMRDMIIEDSPYIGSHGRTRFYLIQPWLKNFRPSEDFYNWCKYLDVDDSKR